FISSICLEMACSSSLATAPAFLNLRACLSALPIAVPIFALTSLSLSFLTMSVSPFTVAVMLYPILAFRHTRIAGERAELRGLAGGQDQVGVEDDAQDVIGRQAKINRGEHRDDDHHGGRGTQADGRVGWHVAFVFVHVHHDDDAQVVVGADNAV